MSLLPSLRPAAGTGWPPRRPRPDRLRRRRPQPARPERPARPARAAQADRAAPSSPSPAAASARRPPPSRAVRPRRASAAGPAPGPGAAPRPGVFDLTPDRGRADARRRGHRVRRPRSSAPRRPRPTRPAPRPRSCSTASLEIGLPILGVPEALGGISEERSAMAGTLVAEALAHGDMGLAVAAPRARLGRHRASACGGPTSSSRPTCRRSPATTCRPPRSRSPSRPSSSTCSRRRPPRRPTGDGFVLDGVKSLVPRGADAELFVVGARARRRAGAVPRRVRRPTA